MTIIYLSKLINDHRFENGYFSVENKNIHFMFWIHTERGCNVFELLLEDSLYAIKLYYVHY